MPTTDDAATARPKFARRPASFSRSEPDAEAPLPPALPKIAAAPKLPAIPPSHPHAWQEDARFGIVMLLLVLLVNLALAYGLPYQPAARIVTEPTQVEAKAPAMPSAIGHERNRVTTYAQPDGERRTIRQLDLREADLPDDSVTVDTPAPVAKPLEEGE